LPLISSMKLYKNLVNSVALTLQEIFVKNRYADKAIERVFKDNAQWGSRDRRFVAEAVYDIVRNFRLYSEIAESPKNFWFITAVWLVVKYGEIPDWQEFKHVDKDFILWKKEELKEIPAIAESYPDWLWALGESELGLDNWHKEAVSMNRQAPVFIRANTLKTSVKKLKELLARENIETTEVAGAPNALMLLKRENVFQNKLFKEGFFEVQDAGSQLISEYLDPKPGEFIIDACAGAGGKSLHMAALMQNKGRIVCMDLESFKLEELKKRAKRAGVFNLETKVIEPGALKGLEKKSDKLLLDVPCSGLGVLKRNPDAKWKLNQGIIDRTRTIQRDILSEYSNMLKVNGTMVYSTCSILPSENRGQIDQFLQHNSAFSLIRERSLFPSEGFDGFYMAELRRNG